MAVKKKFPYRSAFVACNGGCHVTEGSSCSYGCIACGKCVESCKFGAIHLNEHGIAEVDEEKCIACGRCVRECPQHIIHLHDCANTIVVKCSNAPLSTLEEEFFGSEDGDHQPTAGKLELSMGGTLFLDEVEKLPVEMGDKLADALKNGLLNKETGIRKKLNVRVIAACDSNLKRLADKGLFSRSLYELVLDTTIRVPPLRERSKDIEVIAAHILAEMSAQHNLSLKRLSPEALELLKSCSWPGNIKQLQGVIEQAFFHTPGSIIEAENIKLPGDKTLEKSWKYDKDAFIAAWKSSGGNISKLAGMLDVSRVTLYRYLKKYDLTPKTGKNN